MKHNIAQYAPILEKLTEPMQRYLKTYKNPDPKNFIDQDTFESRILALPPKLQDSVNAEIANLGLVDSLTLMVMEIPVSVHGELMAFSAAIACLEFAERTNTVALTPKQRDPYTWKDITGIPYIKDQVDTIIKIAEEKAKKAAETVPLPAEPSSASSSSVSGSSEGNILDGVTQFFKKGLESISSFSIPSPFSSSSSSSSSGSSVSGSGFSYSSSSSIPLFSPPSNQDIRSEFDKLSAEKNAEGLFQRGCELGAQSHVSTMDFLAEASRLGHVEASYLLAHNCAHGGRAEEALQYLKKAAKGGHAQAQFELAKCKFKSARYYLNDGVDIDVLGEAIFELARCGFESGQSYLKDGVDMNAAGEAIEFLLMAKKQKHPKAEELWMEIMSKSCSALHDYLLLKSDAVSNKSKEVDGIWFLGKKEKQAELEKLQTELRLVRKLHQKLNGDIPLLKFTEEELKLIRLSDNDLVAILCSSFYLTEAVLSNAWLEEPPQNAPFAFSSSSASSASAPSMRQGR